MSRCKICDKFVERIYTKTHSVDLINGLTAPIYRYYGEKRSVNAIGSIVFIRKRCVHLPIQSLQRVRISPFSQTMIPIQTEREFKVFGTPKSSAGKRMECSAAEEVQSIKNILPICSIVANFIRKRKNTIFKRTAVLMAEGSQLTVTTKETKEKMLRASKRYQNETKNCRVDLKIIQKVTFLDAEANHHHNRKRCLFSLQIYGVKSLNMLMP